MLNTPSQEELIAAELERRARKRAARSEASAVDLVMEGWASLGVQAADTVAAIRQALEQLLQDSRITDRNHRDVISRAVTEIPDTALPSALKAALADLDPVQLVINLHRLIEAGIPWVSDRGIRRVALLAAPRPQLGTVRPLDSTLLDGDLYWRLYLAILGHPAQIHPEETIPIISQLPLPIVDDLIDMGVIGREDEPWEHREDSQEAVYLRARLAPESISRADAEHIGWKENVARHDFLNGEPVNGDELLEKLAALYTGDTDSFFDLRTVLPPAQRSLLDEILEGARIGRWPQHVTADRGLWGLLVEQWAASVRESDEQHGSDASRGSRLINATHSEFHSWYVLCVVYNWILAGQVEWAIEQAKSLEKIKSTSPSLQVEINNLLAYLAQKPNEQRYEDLTKAEKLLSEVRDLHPSIRNNLTLVQDRRMLSMNDRTSWENPYFTLGLPHGSPDWNEQWQKLSVAYRDDIEKSSIINEALERIQAARKFGSHFFSLPLEPEIMHIPKARSGALIPPLSPLSRQTTTNQDELQFIKSLTAHLLIEDFFPASKDWNGHE
ncbi:hypothetical protein [Planomonospora parontospora]|uniref:hypothetical protein n=1 Tax=Planomonospora parontospora TaxID=58119 RepID=UPI00167087E8|nr:hypothetical protein [Planomonospora parontospora]GGL15947.1 hypothetical protein GCM10014719_17550 [Planomonospora parontospora subsp. antibiotica]GII15434.1 hypothetical protein Ppa05_21600 [Planomonospora parontospora subsp. antibiotica]